MGIVASEIAAHTLIPTFIYGLVMVGLIRFLPARYKAGAAALLFAGCFAWGQMGILGEVPWPPAETAHVLIGLAFGGVVAVCRRSVPFMVTVLLVNVGLYFVLSPLVADGGGVAGQWIAAHILAAAFGGVSEVAVRRGWGRWLALGWALVMAAVGVAIIGSGSTSLAMSAWLLSSLAAIRALDFGRLGAGAPTGAAELITVYPAFVVLLALETYNYVL